jgi:single-stranded DNA-binding protein
MNQTQTQTKATAEIVGRITTRPELQRTSTGVPVCRFTVATDSDGGRTPVVKKVYVVGKSAARPSEDLVFRVSKKLDVGDVVSVPGIERQRTRTKRGVSFPESAIEAEDVKLHAWGPGRGGGA